MSRSGYSDELDNWDLIRWRGRVASSIRGARGQQFLKDLIAALDAMPVKELIHGELETEEGVCAMGCIGKMRGVDVSQLDSYDHEALSKTFKIAECLAQETMWVNDDDIWALTPVERWKRVRKWAEGQVKSA